MNLYTNGELGDVYEEIPQRLFPFFFFQATLNSKIICSDFRESWLKFTRLYRMKKGNSEFHLKVT